MNDEHIRSCPWCGKEPKLYGSNPPRIIDDECPPHDLGKMLERLVGMKKVGDIIISRDGASRVWFISVTDPEFEEMIFESSYEPTLREAVEAAIKAVEDEA